VIVYEIIIGGTLNVLNHIVVSHLKNLTTPDLVHFGYQCSFSQIAISVDMLNKVTLVGYLFRLPQLLRQICYIAIHISSYCTTILSLNPRKLVHPTRIMQTV
jgi:hypothetical protein